MSKLTERERWQRYEDEKRKLPPMPPREYEKAIRRIAERLKI